MNRRQLGAWAETLVATAADIRSAEGRCPTTALLIVAGAAFSLDVVLESDDDKRALRALFEVAARGGAQACALVAEAWRYGGSTERLETAVRHTLNGRSLASLPGRQDVVFVHALSPAAEIVRILEVTPDGTLRRARAGSSRSGILSRFLTGLPWPERPNGGRRSNKPKRRSS